MTMIDEALRYCVSGWTVVPCEGKKPLVSWKEYLEPGPGLLPDRVTEWWTRWPDANIAFVMARHDMFVLDVDGPEGHASLAIAGIRIEQLMDTARMAVMTPRGVHYYFDGKETDRIGLLPKVDLRGQGIVVVPPSVNEKGQSYFWLKKIDPEKPGWPPKRLKMVIANYRRNDKMFSVHSKHWLAEALAGVEEGQRNDMCARLAGYFISHGIPKDVVIQILLAWADRCAPKMDTVEVIATVESIAGKDARNHGHRCDTCGHIQ